MEQASVFQALIPLETVESGDTTETKIPRILIVEDDTTSEAIWHAIAKKAYRHAQIDWATSAIEAEHLIEASMKARRTYDLVITDIFLSGSRTGIDLWQKYSGLIQGQFIITSGIEQDKLREFLGHQLRPPRFLPKPLMINQCVEAIYTAIMEVFRKQSGDL